MFAIHFTRDTRQDLRPLHLFDLAIVAAMVWCVFAQWPLRQYLIPAAALFVLNGIWLVVMTIRHTPPVT